MGLKTDIISSSLTPLAGNSSDKRTWLRVWTYGLATGPPSVKSRLEPVCGSTFIKKGVARIDPKSHSMVWLADSPVPITAEGVCLNGRIYFVDGSSHLNSYRVE